MEKDIAIKVENLSKTFKIPHEKITSLKGAFVSALKSKGYEEFKALDDVSFEVKKGEFFGIIGRNGSGKSTLLKILAGIYKPDKGRVHIHGRISPFLELGIGFNPELSGRDNVYLNAAVLGLTRKQIDEKFDAIVEFSELRRFIDQKVKNYSSGMQVRLAFSVAIHANRDILLMDEVLAVGDTNFQSKCLEEFNKYREQGKTVVLVTHDIETVKKYCNKTMLLRNGGIEMMGNSTDVGNEYIYQNMSDEEVRMVENTKKNKSKEGISKLDDKEIARITRVEYLDKNGNVKNVFKTGDDIVMRVYLHTQKGIRELDLGLDIYSQEDNYIFGINTYPDKIDTKTFISKGYFEIYFKKVKLRTNSYYCSIGLRKKDTKINYDFMARSASFKMFSSDNNQGILSMEYSWKE
ncbi:MAG: ABC transporter ATP-binding protein [Candidatus Moranbacteria bacterium]|nr:ABC transporter ATP-binding protein [Candidatus Moranbacteria bacterium]